MNTVWMEGAALVVRLAGAGELRYIGGAPADCPGEADADVWVTYPNNLARFARREWETAFPSPPPDRLCVELPEDAAGIRDRGPCAANWFRYLVFVRA